MRILGNVVRRYAWGSRTAIASIQRRPVPSAGPEAELWLGAHPSAPSTVCESDRTLPLTELIARDPAAVLGDELTNRFGHRLPYLLKVLAAASPLSLQAHPDAEQARAGFAADDASAAGQRNYVDPYPKPELLVAVDEFDALCGFRDPSRSAALLRSFGAPELAPVLDALSRGPTEARLRAATHLLLTWPAHERKGLVAAVTEPGRSPHSRDPELVRAHALAAQLGQLYPADVGVVLALLLNHVRLRPNEAVFMPVGNLHTYLRGVGVEVMAASDNVLRGGLTTKHVDPVELVRVLRYEVLHDPVLRPVVVADGVITWPTPAAEFALVRAEASATRVTLPGAGPRILICVRGDARLSVGGDVYRVGSGESVFVGANESAVELGGEGAVVFQASPGPPLSEPHP